MVGLLQVFLQSLGPGVVHLQVNVLRVEKRGVQLRNVLVVQPLQNANLNLPLTAKPEYHKSPNPRFLRKLGQL